MLFLLFAITFKFSQTRKKVVINSFCCFLFLSYGNKSQTMYPATYLASPTWAKLLTRFILKFKIFNMYWTRSLSKEKTKQLTCFNWLSNV